MSRVDTKIVTSLLTTHRDSRYKWGEDLPPLFKDWMKAVANPRYDNPGKEGMRTVWGEVALIAKEVLDEPR